MAYDLKELLSLPNDEKLILAQTLWNNVKENSNSNSVDEEIAFIEERLSMHENNPSELMSWEELRNKLNAKHGF
jgi:putative addiction module component (TIGR02574 family)